MGSGLSKSSGFPTPGKLTIKGSQKMRSRKERDREPRGRQQKLQPLIVLSSLTEDPRGESSKRLPICETENIVKTIQALR